MAADPFAPPGADTALRPERLPVSDVMMYHLQRMQPWQGFMGVITLITAALMLVAATLMLLFGLIGGEGGFAVFAALLYGALGAIYAVPGVYLYRSSDALKVAARSGGDPLEHVERSLAMQASFWKFVGVLTIVVLALYAVALTAMCAGALGSMG